MAAGAENTLVLLGVTVAANLYRPAVLDENLGRTPGGTALTGGGHPMARLLATNAGAIGVGQSVQGGTLESGGRQTSRRAQFEKIPSFDLHAFLLLCLLQAMLPLLHPKFFLFQW